MIPTNEQLRMAQILGLPRDDPQSWPLEIIDKLIEIERRDGYLGLHRELWRMLTMPSQDQMREILLISNEKFKERPRFNGLPVLMDYEKMKEALWPVPDGNFRIFIQMMPEAQERS